MDKEILSLLVDLNVLLKALEIRVKELENPLIDWPRSAQGLWDRVGTIEKRLDEDKT